MSVENTRKKSPLQLYQLRYCHHCDFKCNPTEQRALLCVLIWLGDAIHRCAELYKLRSAQL